MIGPSGGPPGVGIESASQDPPSYAFFPSFWSGNSGQQVESNEASTDTLPAQDRSLYRRGGAAPGGARRRGHERRDDTRTTGTSGSLFLSATMSSLASSLGSMFHQNFRLGNPHPEHQVLDDPEMNGGGGTTSQGLASSSNALLGTSTRELRMSNHLVQRQASGNPSNFSDPPDDEDQGLQVVGPATSNQEDLSASRQSTRSEPTACAICLSADQNRLTGPKVRVQACGHQTLHLLCLNDWVQRGNSRRCPICRAYMGAHWVNSNIIQRVQREGDLYGAEAIERIMREEEAARLVAQQAGEPSSTTSGVDNDQLPGVDINDAAAIATSEHEIIHLGIPPGPVGSRDTSGDAHAATSRGALLSSSRGVGFSSGTTRGGGPTYVAPSATTSASPGDDETGLNGTPYGTIRRQFRRLGALRMQRRNRDNISTMSDPDSSSASLFAAAAIESSSDPSSSYNRMNIRSAVLVPAPRQISMEGSPTPSSGGNRLAQSGSTVHRNPDRQMRFNELALENVNGLRQYEDLEAASAEDDPDERTRPMSGMRPQNNELRFLEFERECTLLRELFFDCCIMEICCKNAKCWAGICVAGCIGCCYQDQRWVEGEREVCMQNYFPEYSVPDYMTRGFSHYNEGGSHILFTLRDYLDDENRTRDDAQYGHGGGRGHLPHGGAGAPDAKTFAEAQADEVVIDPNNESVSSSAVLPSNSDTSSARSPSESSTSDVAPPAGARSLRAGQVVHPGHLDWHPHGNSQRDGNDDEERHHHMHFENYRFVSDEEARQHVDEQRWDALKRHFGLKESDFSQELIYLRCMAKPGPGFIDSQLRMRDHDKKSGREYSGREDDTRQKVYYETVGHERRQGSSPWSEDDEGTDVKNGGAQEEHERDKDARRSSQSSPEGTLLRHRLRGSTDVAASSNESTKTSSAGRNRPTEEASSAPDAGARIKTE
ncbi:unnamed protein product [Amoebophrya sp. A25]|nr:unnamed protein product [Amoebophrya sp. A25]|eukprot:GSA25T00009648001.1